MSAKYQQGFTMVELITVMILVGILAAVAMPKFFERGTFDDRAAADQVKAALRYGQKLAIAQRRPVTTAITSAVSAACDLILSGDTISCAIKNDVTLSATQTITFDALGRPAASSVFAVGGTTLTVEAETGYVH